MYSSYLVIGIETNSLLTKKKLKNYSNTYSGVERTSVQPSKPLDPVRRTWTPRERLRLFEPSSTHAPDALGPSLRATWFQSVFTDTEWWKYVGSMGRFPVERSTWYPSVQGRCGDQSRTGGYRKSRQDEFPTCHDPSVHGGENWCNLGVLVYVVYGVFNLFNRNTWNIIIFEFFWFKKKLSKTVIKKAIGVFVNFLKTFKKICIRLTLFFFFFFFFGSSPS